ncbi:hypothetical protein [Sabulicella glaciei]|uniref:Uncharacterized protein n=1 Tax=Sabulicella glaciei TaxID=2984948 RepID=A0ABT3NSD5_9PROT|nr:hypothetical protein [Roseococcus sp. MDT2-1-1]MCW8084773.1 hypothetical protein [Roseococcus sp. MDT2-1-1]
MSALAETWLLVFLLAAGVGLGATLAMALGRLLAESWLDPLRPALAPLSRWAPLVAFALALPMRFLAPYLWPWGDAPTEAAEDPTLVWTTSLSILGLWTALGWMLARPSVGRGLAGAALAALILTGALAVEEWALSRDATWTGSVQGVALMTEQLAFVLAFATLLALRRGEPLGPEARTGLERALLTIAMGMLWLWFTQYVVVYYADIPSESAWYLRRSEGAWAWLMLGWLMPALLCAIALAIVPQWRDWRFKAVARLLLLQHPVHLFWVVRPEAPPGAASVMLDLTVAAALAAGSVLMLRRA